MLDKKKRIIIQNGDIKFSFNMFPIKIRHLDQIDDLIEYIKDNDYNFTIVKFLDIIKDTIDISLDDLNENCLDDLIKIFIDFNFDNKKVKNNKQKQNEDILKAIDFLISEGHSYIDILEYSIFQFSKFVELAIDRKTGYKKKQHNPIDVLKKIGVKVN